MKPYHIYNEYLFYKAGLLGIPYSGSFELTSRCNLDCKMCYIHRRANDREVIKKEWTTQQWKELAVECQKAGMLNLLLTGGEPLLRKDFFEIFEFTKKLGMMVSINSNGTCIDDKTVKYFANNPPTRINITLYGSSQETYGLLCGDESAYEKVVRNIVALKEAGVLVKLNYSVTPYNFQDMENAYLFAKEKKLPIQFATYMFPPMRACEMSNCTSVRLTPEESARAQIAYDRLRFDTEELKERWKKQLDGVRAEEPDEKCKDFPDTPLRCRAGSSTFWVTWDGKIRPCGMMTTPSFDLNEVGFAEAWNAIRAATKEIFIPKQCIGCNLKHACDQCAAICHSETGSFQDVPTYMCERTKAYMKLISESYNDRDIKKDK